MNKSACSVTEGGPRGIQAVWTGSWQFPVQDGLGSVRNNALSYSPFGVPDAAVEGFAFTGEMRDANGLQYHRARYYVPELGVWLSLDPVEGVIQRAMSLNGYSWVEGNIPNATDPSGNTPDRGEMERGDKFRYSCNCGWLDAAHMDFGVPAGIEKLVNYPINWGAVDQVDPRYNEHKLRAITTSIITVALVPSGVGYAIVNELSNEYSTNPEGIALGIWMEAQLAIEENQKFLWPASTTSFSIEDLVSNLTGYAAYKAGQQWETPQASELLFSLGRVVADYSPTWNNQWLQDTCGVLSKDESLDMYDKFEQAGGFPKNHGWTPLSLPAGVENPYCEAEVTAAYLNTPMMRLLSTAVYSDPTKGDAAWWWENGNDTKIRVADFDSNLNWAVLRDNLYITLPIECMFGGCC